MKKFSREEAENGFFAVRMDFPHMLQSDVDDFVEDIINKEQDDDFSFASYASQKLPMDRYLVIELEDGDIINAVIDVGSREIVWKDNELTTGREYNVRVGDIRLAIPLIYMLDERDNYVLDYFRGALQEAEVIRGGNEIRDLCFEERWQAIDAAKDISRKAMFGLDL